MNVQDIRNLNPCYDPSKYLKEDWVGSVQDILRMSDVPPYDRLWVCCRNEFIKEDLLFKFSEQCCWEIVEFLPEDDQLEYCNILCIIRYAREIKCDETLYAAKSATRYAAEFATKSVAESAAEYAAEFAAEHAADLAAELAARYAAKSASMYKWCDYFCHLLADMIDES